MTGKSTRKVGGHLLPRKKGVGTAHDSVLTEAIVLHKPEAVTLHPIRVFQQALYTGPVKGGTPPIYNELYSQPRREAARAGQSLCRQGAKAIPANSSYKNQNPKPIHLANNTKQPRYKTVRILL